MNKNTTDITLSAYFNDIVIGYYEDEDLVKQFGRQLGFDVDMDTFMAVSFQYPSDMNVKPEDREKLTDAANAIIALSDINKKIGGKQIITCDSGDVGRRHLPVDCRNQGHQAYIQQCPGCGKGRRDLQERPCDP